MRTRDMPRMLAKEHAEQLPIFGGRIRRTAGQVWEHFTEGCGAEQSYEKWSKGYQRKPNHVVKIHFRVRVRVTHSITSAATLKILCTFIT